MNNKGNNTLKKIGLYILVIIGVVISIFPFYWMFIGSTSSSGKILSTPPNLWPGDQLLTNWKNLNESVDILRVTFNSIFIAHHLHDISFTLWLLGRFELAIF